MKREPRLAAGLAMLLATLSPAGAQTPDSESAHGQEKPEDHRDPRRHAPRRLLLAAREVESRGARSTSRPRTAYADAFMKGTEALPEEALRRDARPHQADGPVGSLPDARVFLLHAHGDRKAVPHLLPQEGHARRGGAGRPRLERDGQGRAVHGLRRLGRERRRQPHRLHDGQHGLPRLHAPRQGSRRPERSSPSRSRRSPRSPGPPTARRSSMPPTTAAKRPYRIYRHALGADPKTDALVYEEKDEMFRVGVHALREPRLSAARVELAHRRASGGFCRRRKPAGEWTLVAPREKEHEYDVDHRGDLLYIRTNSGGCRNFRLVTAPHRRSRGARTGRKSFPAARTSWSPASSSSPTTWSSGARGRPPRIRIVDFAIGRHPTASPFPRRSMRRHPSNNIEFDTSTVPLQLPVAHDPVLHLRLRPEDASEQAARSAPRSSAATIRTSTRPSVATPRRATARRSRCRSSIGRASTRTARTRRCSTATAPTARPILPTFNSNRVSLLDRGFVYVIGHIRGGGEMGKKWHDQGRR